MRFGKALLALAATAFLLLMLSALVVYTPEEAVAAPAEAAPVRAVLMPFALPAQDGASDGRQAEGASRLFAFFVFLAGAYALPKLVLRDANGRVLRSRRYEDSFYPVFRPEVAGG